MYSLPTLQDVNPLAAQSHPPPPPWTEVPATASYDFDMTLYPLSPWVYLKNFHMMEGVESWIDLL